MILKKNGAGQFFRVAAIGAIMMSEALVSAMDSEVLIEEKPAAVEAVKAPTIAVDDIENSPLHAAAHVGDCKAIEALLAQGVHVDLAILDGSTPLLAAALGGQVDATKLLLSRGANVHAAQPVGETPEFTALHVAALNGRLEVAQLLLAAGANVNVPAVDGITPLHAASGLGACQRFADDLPKDDLVKFLISKGANVKARQLANGITPLHLAWGKEAVETLLAAGAERDALDTEGQTPLHHAAQSKFHHSFFALVAAGADPKAKDKKGVPAIEARDDEGRTILFWAIAENNVPVTKRLLELGANLEAADNQGRMAFGALKSPLDSHTTEMRLLLFEYWKPIDERLMKQARQKLWGHKE